MTGRFGMLGGGAVSEACVSALAPDLTVVTVAIPTCSYIVDFGAQGFTLSRQLRSQARLPNAQAHRAGASLSVQPTSRCRIAGPQEYLVKK